MSVVIDGHKVLAMSQLWESISALNTKRSIGQDGLFPPAVVLLPGVAFLEQTSKERLVLSLLQTYSSCAYQACHACHLCPG